MIEYIKEERRKGERRRMQSERWMHLLGGALVEERRKSDRRTVSVAAEAPPAEPPEGERG